MSISVEMDTCAEEKSTISYHTIPFVETEEPQAGKRNRTPATTASSVNGTKVDTNEKEQTPAESTSGRETMQTVVLATPADLESDRKEEEARRVQDMLAYLDEDDQPKTDRKRNQLEPSGLRRQHRADRSAVFWTERLHFRGNLVQVVLVQVARAKACSQLAQAVLPPNHALQQLDHVAAVPEDKI
nr:hypothetical protein BaRGS_032828 [Batillaria attramentaria]